MIVTFKEAFLRDMYVSGKSDKKHPYQPGIIKKYKEIIQLMVCVDNVDVLREYNSLNYEHLKGNMAGISSVRVNNKYRIEFEESVEDGKTIASICNIIDLSNHYQ